MRLSYALRGGRYTLLGFYTVHVVGTVALDHRSTNQCKRSIALIGQSLLIITDIALLGCRVACGS